MTLTTCDQCKKPIADDAMPCAIDIKLGMVLWPKTYHKDLCVSCMQKAEEEMSSWLK